MKSRYRTRLYSQAASWPHERRAAAAGIALLVCLCASVGPARAQAGAPPGGAAASSEPGSALPPPSATNYLDGKILVGTFLDPETGVFRRDL